MKEKAFLHNLITFCIFLLLLSPLTVQSQKKKKDRKEEATEIKKDTTDSKKGKKYDDLVKKGSVKKDSSISFRLRLTFILKFKTVYLRESFWL